MADAGPCWAGWSPVPLWEPAGSREEAECTLGGRPVADGKEALGCEKRFFRKQRRGKERR